MELTNAKKKHLRSIAHSLNPVVIIAEKGLSDGVNKELERALEDHELIKVKININDGDTRKTIAAQVCEQRNAALVQLIGKMVILFRAAKKPNPKLSNLKKPT
jgi:RNA-binding protein